MNKAEPGEIKLITIDGDGCLFSYENVGSAYGSSWDALGFAFGLKPKFDDLIKKYYGRKEEGADKKWSEEEAAMLKELEVRKCFNVLYPIPYCPGAQRFADATKGKIKRGILSTGIDLVVAEACEELGFDFAFCNVLNQNKGVFDGTVRYNVPLWRKEEKIAEICERFAVRNEEICHIGDNENDLPVAEKVGMFIALNPKKDEVRKAARSVAYSFHDVMGILGIGGWE